MTTDLCVPTERQQEHMLCFSHLPITLPKHFNSHHNDQHSTELRITSDVTWIMVKHESLNKLRMDSAEMSVETMLFGVCVNCCVTFAAM